MLSYLSIKNVSVIESVSFELDSHLNVLTGETGSGKSVLVGALKLLLGERFQRTMLREGAKKLMVEAIFDQLAQLPADLKEMYEVEDELNIRREVDESGKNRVFINGRVATVGQLKEFAPYLADIHGQHEHQALMNEARHIEFIDHLVPQALKDSYAEAFSKYKAARADKKKLLDTIDDMQKHREIVDFQLQDINRAEIKLEEDSQLDEKVTFLSHIEKIREACSVSLEALSDGEINASDLLAKAMRALEPLSAMMQELNPAMEGLGLAVENIDMASRMLSSIVDRQEASPEELDRLMQRKYLLQDLVKKYGGSLDAVLNKRDELDAKLRTFEDSSAMLAHLEKLEKSALDEAHKKAKTLLDARKKVSEQIAKQVIAVLKELELPHSRFSTVFEQNDMLDTLGGVEAKFYISVNKGFEPAPLAQVASGGEISRVMLALKEVFSDSDPVSTMLFDEIDTGISGITARKVAERLKHLSQNKQVIVITHLPVVAAKGDTHFYIKKGTDGNTTRTTITMLDEEARTKMIASMIAGEPTEAALRQAKELLEG